VKGITQFISIHRPESGHFCAVRQRARHSSRHGAQTDSAGCPDPDAQMRGASRLSLHSPSRHARDFAISTLLRPTSPRLRSVENGEDFAPHNRAPATKIVSSLQGSQTSRKRPHPTQAQITPTLRARHALCFTPPARFVCGSSTAPEARRGCLAAAGALSSAHCRAG